MQVNGKTQKIDELVSSINAKKIIKSTHGIESQIIPFTKKQLWIEFKKVFIEMYQKDLIIDFEETLENLKVLFNYFLQDQEFFNCRHLRGDISKPSFKKGLLIIGGYGLGKTDYFKVFERVFAGFTEFRFKFYTSTQLVNKYELCKSPLDKRQFYKNMARKKMFIDDLNSERFASNYGKIDLLKDVLYLRYDRNLVTFVSCNYSDVNQCVNQTLRDLGLRYGARIYDRYFEMFNIIEFKGKSFRR